MEVEQIEKAILASGNKLLEFNKGHMKQFGVDAGILKNPYWRVFNEASQKELIFMSVGHRKMAKLCPLSLQKIRDYEEANNDKMTFYVMQNGYVGASNKLYMHQIILNHFGNGSGTKTTSIDHIDRDPLNNTWENLRIATRHEQEQNSKGIMKGTKRERKHNAKPLPPGITHDMMGRYVTYYEDKATETRASREYFKVEKHPKLPKIWIGCKRGDVSIQEKLAQANKVVENLENNIYPVLPNYTYPAGVQVATSDMPAQQPLPAVNLPRFCSMKEFRGKPHLEFDRRGEHGARMTVLMVCKPDEDIQLSIAKLRAKVEAKYGPDAFSTQTQQVDAESEDDDTEEDSS